LEVGAGVPAAPRRSGRTDLQVIVSIPKGVSWVHRNSFFPSVGTPARNSKWLPSMEQRGTAGLLLNRVLATAKDKAGVK
jgi:hypothetical protein